MNRLQHGGLQPQIASSSFDNVCKALVEKYPADFAWCLIGEEANNTRVLKTELSLEPIRTASPMDLQSP